MKILINKFHNIYINFQYSYWKLLLVSSVKLICNITVTAKLEYKKIMSVIKLNITRFTKRDNKISLFIPRKPSAASIILYGAKSELYVWNVNVNFPTYKAKKLCEFITNEKWTVGIEGKCSNEHCPKRCDKQRFFIVNWYVSYVMGTVKAKSQGRTRIIDAWNVS